MPKERVIDSTLSLLRDPYGFIAKRCRNHQSDLFEARLLFRPVICMTGRQAAELLYDTNRFSRDGAVPLRIQRTLFGVGEVQGLDDEAHRHRKSLFIDLVQGNRVASLVGLTRKHWEKAAERWESMDRVTLYPEVREILACSVCAWAGAPLRESEVQQRVFELTAMYDYAGSVGPLHIMSRLGRKRGERWAAGLIEQERAKEPPSSDDHALRRIATYRDQDGRWLDVSVAAVELLNLLRPTVAVSVYITFAAVALHLRPALRDKLRTGGDDYRHMFAQEVRRFYPFFPTVVAKVRREFQWRGYRFPKGRRVLLDLYGTNHDPRSWERPEEFDPERFKIWSGCPYSFIPQGGGDRHLNHRCPGEDVAIELVKSAVDILVNHLTYEVPRQDLTIDRRRLPALPRSKFVIEKVRRVAVGAL